MLSRKTTKSIKEKLKLIVVQVEMKSEFLQREYKGVNRENISDSEIVIDVEDDNVDRSHNHRWDNNCRTQHILKAHSKRIFIGHASE